MAQANIKQLPNRKKRLADKKATSDQRVSRHPPLGDIEAGFDLNDSVILLPLGSYPERDERIKAGWRQGRDAEEKEPQN